jgi:uncharacterized damage-inducible protein DinB
MDEDIHATLRRLAMTSDPVEVLLAQDKWATGLMLDVCAKLSDEQWHRKFEMGPGSLHNTLVHMLSAIRAWTQLLAGEAPGARMDQSGEKFSPADLKGKLDEFADAFAREVRRLPLSETITRERGGKMYTFTRGQVLAHVTTHEFHHRAQCLNMLRHVGVKELPPSSVAEWSWMADATK